ncbi:transcriptional repressor [Candidatus Parcubacteria bacterium]|nr:MAG: transcriptional repressor [Candidatus Parcubacteria bacterium]
MSCYQDLTQELRQAGLRMTPQRLMVMDAVFHHEGHITAEDIHAKVQARYPYVDLSTVYRTLQVLKEQGLVVELQVPDGPTQYEGTQKDSHHHAICRRCGTMLDVQPDALEPIREQLLAQHGFRAEFSHMAILGLCKTCAEQREQQLRDEAR